MPTLKRSLLVIVLGGVLLASGCSGAYLLAGGSGRPQPSASATATSGLGLAPQSSGTAPAGQAPILVPRIGATEAPTATGQALLSLPGTGAVPATNAPVLGTPGPEAVAGVLATAEKPPRDMRLLAMRLKPGVGNIPLVVNAQPPSYKVGDQARFWIENEDTQQHHQITATLVYETSHVYMWVEDGVHLDQAGVEKSANLFETKTYPTDRQYFGSEWSPGVDDDVHLTVLHARGLGSTVAGYFSGADEYSHLAYAYSNQREMFYISADQQGPAPGTAYYDGVLAHEFQHMIHWSQHRNEDSWVNEGMSMLAMRLNGFDTGSPDVEYASQPDTQLDTWDDPSTSPDADTGHYGASYLFMDYFLDRFGANLLKARIADHQDSIAGFNDALAKAGRPERFDGLFADWLVANLVNQPNADPQGRFGYRDITPPRLAITATYQSMPVESSGVVKQYGADYMNLKAGTGLTINFFGQPTVPVVGAQLHGRYAWYSNRGDDDDTTLTRSVDLSKVASATLTFSAWYDMEDGWDYTYVEASTDGGQHWQVLPGLHSRNSDLTGNAYGPGWTGISGAGKSPVWTDERVDLSAYVGKQILLRFETITDDAYNGPGFLLDGVAIPEIGFTDGSENGTNGWQAAGYVLTDNVLPEQWLVELVSRGPNGLRVQQMQVRADGHGDLAVAGSPTDTDVTLIVSAMAPVTTEEASFQYTVGP